MLDEDYMAGVLRRERENQESLQAIREIRYKKLEEIRRQTRELVEADGWNKFVFLYANAHDTYGNGRVPDPQEILVGDGRIGEQEEKDLEGLARIYRQGLFEYNIQFLRKHGAQIPAAVWIPFLSEAVVSGDINAETAKAIGYDLKDL
jgi:hypothetical protein